MMPARRLPALLRSSERSLQRTMLINETVRWYNGDRVNAIGRLVRIGWWKSEEVGPSWSLPTLQTTTQLLHHAAQRNARAPLARPIARTLARPRPPHLFNDGVAVGRRPLAPPQPLLRAPRSGSGSGRLLCTILPLSPLSRSSRTGSGSGCSRSADLLHQRLRYRGALRRHHAVSVHVFPAVA